MLLSELLEKKMDINYEIKNEREIMTVGLVVSEIDVPFCTFVDDEKYLEVLPSNAKMLIVSRSIANKLKTLDEYGICVVENPRNVFFKLHNVLEGDYRYVREKKETTYGEDCFISELAVIANNNVEIGNNVTIEPLAVIKENTKIGDNCIIRSGAVIGGTDFEFKRENGTIFGVNHYGGVIIGNDVEIQYNSGINKALYPWDNTVVGDYTKIDMLVHIAHGVKIGRACMIVANSGIGGRTTIGNECWVGFGSTIKNGIQIGDNARVNMGAVVTKSVGNGESVTGNFAIDHTKFINNLKKICL